MNQQQQEIFISQFLILDPDDDPFLVGATFTTGRRMRDPDDR